MTIAKIDWSEPRITPVILIAGVPIVLTAAGVKPTSVAVVGGTLDPLFWPGVGPLFQSLPNATTFDPVKDLLDAEETFEVYEKISLLEGSVSVGTFTFSVLDPDLEGTALLSGCDSLVNQRLLTDLTASATIIEITNGAGFPAGYIASIGRETVLYDGIAPLSPTGAKLDNVVRGKYGSVARVHTAPEAHRPLVSAGGPRYWQGRQASVYLCQLSEDGLVLTNPTLIFLGAVGAGVQTSHNLTRWSVPLDHAIEALGRKLTLPKLELYGWQHYGPSDFDYHPFQVISAIPNFDAVNASMTDQSGDPNNNGWHPSATSFFTDARRYASTVLTPQVASISLTSDARASCTVNAVPGTTHIFTIGACWDTARWEHHQTDETEVFRTVAPVPSDCFHLNKFVKVPQALDWAKIPSTFSWALTTTLGYAATAYLTISGNTAKTEDFTAKITARTNATQTLFLQANIPNVAAMTAAAVAEAARCIERTTVVLGIVAVGGNAVSALRAASLGITALVGQDLYDTAIDWDGIERAFASAPARITEAREYRFGEGDDTLLSVLTEEARLHGMSLAIVNGLISAVRLSVFANTEVTVGSIVETDLRVDTTGKELPAGVVDSTEPLATSIEFSFPSSDPENPSKITITDTTFQGEFGDGERLECKALMNLPAGSDLTGVRSAMVDLAQQILQVLAIPTRMVTLEVSPALLNLQPGDLISFTHSRIPNWSGTRGFTNAVFQIQEVRRQLFGGKMSGSVVLRVQSGDRSAYTPEALVAAGGISAISAVVTLDTTTGFGTTCFAPATGAASAPSVGFAIGDKVVLSQLERVPIADESFGIIGITPTTITLSSTPSAPMVAAAAAAYGVTLKFQTYLFVAAAQKPGWAYVADAATELLDSTDAAKRWS